MQLPFSSKTLARCVALALVAAPAFAGEIRSIDGGNLRNVRATGRFSADGL